MDKNNYLTDELIVLSCNIDDFNPQNYEYISDRLFTEAKVLDVWLTPIIMKKSRSANTLSVLTHKQNKLKCLDILFEETSTLGVREEKILRYSLQREFKIADTIYGKINCKIAKRGEEILNISAEYEDCKKSAKLHHVPLKQVQQTALTKLREELNL